MLDFYRILDLEGKKHEAVISSLDLRQAYK